MDMRGWFNSACNLAILVDYRGLGQNLWLTITILRQWPTQSRITLIVVCPRVNAHDYQSDLHGIGFSGRGHQILGAYYAHFWRGMKR